MLHRTAMLPAFIVTAMAIAPPTAADERLDQPQTVVQQQDAADRRAADSPNVRIEVVLTDRAEGKTLAEERLTVLVADRQLGRLRRHMPGYEPAFNRNFEVDVTPTVLGSRIRLALTVNYQTQRDSAGGAEPRVPQTVQFVQTATSFVEPDKPTTMIDVTGDPANRRVTVQATATILK